MNKPSELTEQILKVLNDRGGFDHWWDDILEEDQIDIKADLDVVIKAIQDEAFKAGMTRAAMEVARWTGTELANDILRMRDELP